MRKVVVTGVGMTTPLAVSTEESWLGLVHGKSGIRAIPEWQHLLYQGQALATRFAGRVPDFDPEPWLEHKKDKKRTARFTQLGSAAAEQAWRQAGLAAKLEGEDAERSGCLVGVGIGGLGDIIENEDALRAQGPRRVSAFAIPMLVPNMLAGNLTLRYNLRGPSFAPASACASGAHGIGEAFMHIRDGRADRMLCGGAESTLEPLAMASFGAMRALSTRNDAPELASRPFDKDRDGFVMGEGAGMLVLEAEEVAKKRGANILAEIKGYGATSDAHHITVPCDDGEGAQRAFRAALRMAELAPDAVDYINAHGTSTPYNDESETRAIKAVFGAHASSLWISSTKSMTGHLLGGAGGVEAVISVLALSRGVIPPTINQTTPDPRCDLDYVPNVARERRVDVVQSNSFGFGGTNAVLLFARV